MFVQRKLKSQTLLRKLNRAENPACRVCSPDTSVSLLSSFSMEAPEIAEEPALSDTELKYMKEHLEKLMSHPLAIAFLEPVDPEAEGLPNYNKVIKHPMDLGTIKKKLHDDKYKTVDEFVEDINLVWRNAIKFNGKKSLLKFCAEKLQRKCARWFEMIPSDEIEVWEMEVRNREHELMKILKYGITGENEVPVLDSLRFHVKESPPNP